MVPYKRLSRDGALPPMSKTFEDIVYIDICQHHKVSYDVDAAQVWKVYKNLCRTLGRFEAFVCYLCLAYVLCKFACWNLLEMVSCWVWAISKEGSRKGNKCPDLNRMLFVTHLSKNLSNRKIFGRKILFRSIVISLLRWFHNCYAIHNCFPGKHPASIVISVSNLTGMA